MIFSKREKISFYFISALLYFLAWIIQSQMLIKGDVSWQMHLARSVLNGGNYIKDFFEINPPLSIFLYMPEIFIEKILFVSHIIGLRIYMFLCATGSLLICYVLIKKLFVQYDTKIAFIFLLSLIFIDLILPLNEFGQRENLLVILTMPYFLLAACRVNKIKINLFFAIFIGLLAALGFGLKPFFLIAFILVEGYVAFKTNIKNMFRPENMGIVLFLLLYFFVILLFFTSYLTVVTPVALRFYYQLFSKPIKICLLLLPVYFCFFTFIFYYIQHKKNAYDALSSVLALALLGFFIAYLIQRIPWYYHFLPVFSFTVLLSTFLFSLYARKSNIFLSVAIGLAMFFYPLSFILCFSEIMIQQKKELNPIIQFLHIHAFQKPVYYFSAYDVYMVSVLEHAGCASFPSRLQFLAWMRRGIDQNMKKDNNFFINMLSQDLNHYKPVLILVDQMRYEKNNHVIAQINYLSILNKNKQFRLAWKHYHYFKEMKKNGLYDFALYRRYPCAHLSASV